jgi:hypothetical protein
VIEGSTHVSLNEFHERLVAEICPGPLTDLDAMLLFAVLHTHRINLASGILSDAPEIRSLPAITQRHAAACIAGLWRKAADERADDTHWYWIWDTEWSDERVRNLAGDELARFHEMKETLAAHPAVQSIEADEE